MPAGISFEDGISLLSSDPKKFRRLVQSSLNRHVNAVNTLSENGTRFWDYGNAFLLESGRADANVFSEDGSFRYPSYVEDIMGPMCFDYGFGPFRWVCTSGKRQDLATTDEIAQEVLEDLASRCPEEIRTQYLDNIKWISEAEKHDLVVGSMARILYADEEGRRQIALRFNEAISEGLITAPIVLGRDHHDVAGTDLSLIHI